MGGRGSRRYFFPTIGVAGGGAGLDGRIKTVSSANLISYKILGESSGTVAIDQVGATLNGTHTGVTLGNPGVGGYLCPLYDGANDYTNIYSAAFASAFSPVAGTVLIYSKMSAAGVWTDATIRYVLRIMADSTNQITIIKTATNNQITFSYQANSVASNVTTTAFGGNVGWMLNAFTWNTATAPTGEVKLYGNAVALGTVAQIGSTVTGLGAWSGSLNADFCLVGARVNTPANVWSGYANHLAIFNKELSLAELQYIHGSGI